MGKRASSSAKASADAKRRQLNRRSTDEQADRALREHCPELSSTVTDMVKIEGHTMRERILADKRSKKNTASGTGLRFSSAYWQTLKTTYQAAAGTRTDLSVKNRDEVVDDELQKALELYFQPNTTKRSASALRSWLSVSPLPNQRSYVGLMKAVETSKLTSPQAVAVVVDTAKFVVRVGADTKYSAETQALTRTFDLALSQTWATLRRDSVSLDTFLKMYAQPLGLVLSVATAAKVADCNNDYTKCADEIVALCKSGTTGKNMFQGFLVHVGEARLEALMDAEVASLGDSPITAEWVAKTRRAILDEADRLGCEDALNSKRNIKIAYRSFRLPIQVSSLTQELDIRIASLLKTRSVGTSSLPWLVFEQDFGLKWVPRIGLVDASLVRDMASARKAANDKVRDLSGDDLSGDMLKEVLAGKQQLMLSIDSSWLVEAAFVKFVTGEGGEQDLKDKILRTFPEDGNKDGKTFHSVHKALSAIQKEKCFDYYSRAAKAKLHSILDLVDQMCKGFAPPVFQHDGSDDPFMASIRERVDFFPVWEGKVGTSAGAKKQRLSGLKALKELLTAASKKTTITLAELDILNVLKCRLSADDQAEVSRLTDAAIAGGNIGGDDGAAASHASSSNKAEKTAKHTAKRVAGFFS